MKTLVNTFYNLELRLIENAITVLSVEAPSAYQKIMHDFWQQYNGNEGSFILSENGKELKIQKNVECIYNPWTYGEVKDTEKKTTPWKRFESFVNS